MNPDWKTFLAENGAVFSANIENESQAETLESFGDLEAEQKAPLQGLVVCDLSDRGLIKISGEDAESFLQNQLTNDIRNVTETSHQPSAWCSPKGRMIASFRIFKRGDSFYLSLSADLLEQVMKKLQMYIMMSKVSLEDVSRSVIHIGFAGENADQTLQTILNTQSLELPSEADQVSQHGETSVLNISDTVPRFEIFTELKTAQQIWKACRASATATSSKAWNYLNIMAGLPVITQASSESWIPQMVNYIAIGGVDFKKGCYPGQEVVARLNYLGKTKRRMYLLEIDSPLLPAAGDGIASDSDKATGKILSAAINPAGKVQALAVLKISEAENPLQLADGNQSNLRLLDLPYSLDDD